MQRRRMIGALAMTASSLAACNALLSLDDEYRLARDGGDVPRDEAGKNDVGTDTGNADTSVDAGIDCWANPKIVKSKPMSDQPDWPVPNAARMPSVDNPASYDASVPGEVYDNITRLTWLAEVDAAAVPLGTYAEVSAACASRGARLATRMELVSIQATYNDPDATAGTDPQHFPNTEAFYYWSSTKGAKYPQFVWAVNFDVSGFGFYDSQDTSSSYYGRCVRGPAAGPPLPPHRYEVSEACGIVRDVRTRLEWERGKGTQAIYNQAEFRCIKELPKLGANDWRMPTYAELASIVLSTRADPTLDIDAFEPGANGDYWTSTKPFRLENNRIIIQFIDGFAANTAPVTRKEVWGRCVRTMD